jgi:Predicted membrane protein
MALYFFFAFFPLLLLLLILLDQTGGASDWRDALLDSFKQALPPDASALITQTIEQLNARAGLGTGAILAGIYAAWGALNGTWAMMTGLNKAYEVEEQRAWWRILYIMFGLTISLSILGGGRARLHRLWQSNRKHRRPTSWCACSLRISRAHHTVGRYRNSAASIVCCALSFRAELKGSALAMEYSRCGCRCHIMGSLYTAASAVPGALRFFKDLWTTECGGHASALALSHRRGYLYWR